MRGVFLDISKAFDKVWYKVVVLKLIQNDICLDLPNILCDSSNDRKQ